MRKTVLGLIGLLLCAACADPYDDISFAQVEPFRKVFRESSHFPEYTQPAEVAKGEHATFQFVIKSAKPITGLKASVRDLQQGNEKLSDISIGFVDYVHVGRQTPDRAKDALVSNSGYFPDPVIQEDSRNVERDIAQPIWVTVAVPRSAQPGDYTGEFIVEGKSGGQSFTLKKKIGLKVYPVVLEEPSLWVTNWYSTSPEKLKLLNNGQEVVPYSDRYWELMEQFALVMKEVYQNVALVSPLRLTRFEQKDKQYQFDFTNFDKTVQLFLEKGGIKRIEGGHIGGRTGDWNSQFAVSVPEQKDGKQVFTNYPITSEIATNFYRQFIPALMNHLKEKGWDQIYCQHIADEPTEVNIKSYTDISRFVKKLAPDVKIIEACHTHDLENMIDIWVPQLNFYADGYDFYKTRQKAEDEVWFYTCLAPQGDFANRFIEQPLLKTRLIHWLNFRYGATGYLHWGMNYWNTENPYEETTGINLEGGNILPGGDSWFVYPANGRFNTSIRFAAMRDGIADYTLLQMLAQKDEALAKELCRQMVYNWTRYDMEENHFRSIRRQILETLSK